MNAVNNSFDGDIDEINDGNGGDVHNRAHDNN